MKNEPLFPGINPTWSRRTNCMLLDFMCYGFCRVFTSVFISGVGLYLRGEVALITFFFFFHKMKENGPKELRVFRQLHNRVRVKPELEIQLPVTANLYRSSGLELLE